MEHIFNIYTYFLAQIVEKISQTTLDAVQQGSQAFAQIQQSFALQQTIINGLDIDRDPKLFDFPGANSAKCRFFKFLMFKKNNFGLKKIDFWLNSGSTNRLFAQFWVQKSIFGSILGLKIEFLHILVPNMGPKIEYCIKYKIEFKGNFFKPKFEC